MKKFLTALLVTTAISTAAMAASAAPAAAPAGAALTGDYKADARNYNSMTKDQKLKFIEERRNAMIQKSNDKWKNMSDDEKIAKYEHGRTAAASRREQHNSVNAASNAITAGSVPNAASAVAAPKN